MDIEQVEKDVLSFWFGEDPDIVRAAWFEKDDAFDTTIVTRFGSVYDAAAIGQLDAMANTPLGCLTLVIVLDQFPRNMFRDDPRAFATDGKALDLSRTAIERGLDRTLGALQRQFLYMPFQHSEDLVTQRRSIELFADTGPDGQEYAKRHLDIIERFDRFPHRNAILGRESTPEELAFLQQPDSSF